MIIIDDYKKILSDSRPKIDELRQSLAYDRLGEKKEELERLRVQRESLLKIETEQKLVIEKLSNNEDN